MANKAYEKLCNRKVEDLLGRNIREVFPELIGTGTFELFDKVFETGETFTAPEYAAMIDLNNEGVLRQCYFNFSMESLKNDSGEIYAVIAMIFDVTEQIESRKRIEESDKALRASQEVLKINEVQLQNIFHATKVAIGVLEGPEHKYTFVNPVTCQILNRTKEELLGKTVKEVFSEVEAQDIIQLFDEVYNTGKPFAINELPIQMDILKNGVVGKNYHNLSCEPLRDREGKIYAILVTGVDVTEQVLARKKIEESENRFHELIYSSPSMIAILREDLIIEIANDAILEQLGKGKHIIDLPFSKAVPEMEEQGFGELLRQVYKTGIPYHAHEMPGNLLYKGIEITNYYNFIYQPQRNINGEIEGVAILANQVTPQALLNKKIEESEQRYHELFMNSPFCFFNHGRKRYGNYHCQ